MKVDSEAGNRYILVVVDKASKFLFAYPTRTKEALGAAQHLLTLCFIFGTPVAIAAIAGVSS